MNKRKSNFTADFLITDAKVRLAFERTKNKTSQLKLYDNNIVFLPLAAAGNVFEEKVKYFSQDHNFSVSFRSAEENCICELQAQGYNFIEAVKNKSVPVTFDEKYHFLFVFDEKGFARLRLPNQTPQKISWVTLPFKLKI